jgi:hypothetical protein
MRPSAHVFRSLPSATASGRSESLDLQVRLTAEFSEMPGLRLTLAQAVRLFSLDTERCAQVLDILVERGVLSTDGRAFTRADSGRRSV